MVAFVELIRAYAVAGKVERSAHSIQSIRAYDDPSQSQKLRDIVAELNQEMDSWVGDLPDCVRLAVNNPDRDSVFLLSMLSHMTLFAATINLREFIASFLARNCHYLRAGPSPDRPFIPEHVNAYEDMTSLVRCISAAKGCIRVGGMIKDVRHPETTSRRDLTLFSPSSADAEDSCLTSLPIRRAIPHYQRCHPATLRCVAKRC
jgi:hypothetical protein